MEIASELCFWALYTAVYSDHILCAQSHTLLIDTLETKAPLRCPGQLRPHQHTQNTHRGAAPHVVSHHMDKRPLVLEERVGEEPMLVGGDLSR